MDTAKRLMLAAIGALHLSKERLEEMMDELVKKGEMTSSEKAEALKRLAEKVESSTEKAKEAIEKQVENTMKKLNLLAKIDRLAERLDLLEKEIAELKSKKSTE